MLFSAVRLRVPLVVLLPASQTRRRAGRHLGQRIRYSYGRKCGWTQQSRYNARGGLCESCAAMSEGAAYVTSTVVGPQAAKSADQWWSSVTTTTRTTNRNGKAPGGPCALGVWDGDFDFQSGYKRDLERTVRDRGYILYFLLWSSAAIGHASHGLHLDFRFFVIRTIAVDSGDNDSAIAGHRLH